MTRRVGIYPGTFDPIHHGHIAFAKETIRERGLDRVVFLAEPTPRGKNCSSTLDERVEKIKHATTQHADLDVITVKSNQFTVSATLPEIKALFPGAELTFLIGSDVLFGLKDWGNLKDLIESTTIGIGLRSDCTKEMVDTEIKAIEALVNTPVRYVVIETDHRHVSSTQIKRLSSVI